MVLVDTSIWIGHLRAADHTLVDLLTDDLARCHPWVIGELALGSLADRQAVLDDMRSLPPAVVATDAEMAQLIEDEHLYARGIGYVDAQLLASARLSSVRLWTTDKRLRTCAIRLGIAY